MQIMEKEAASEFKHLVLVKFKEDVVVDDVFKGLEKLVAEMDIVKSFVWGQDNESEEMLRQGFTHALLMTFDSKQDYATFVSHPNHVDFSGTFSKAIEKAVVLDFPVITVKKKTAAAAEIVISEENNNKASNGDVE